MTKHSLSTLLFSGLKILAVLSGLLVLLGWSSDYFITRSIISDIYRDFYSYTQEKPVDVLVVGASHSQAGINTLRLSKQLNASVYTLALPAQGIGQTYYTLKDALNHIKPEIVIIDSFFAGQPGILQDREYFAYEHMRAMESKAVKAEYLMDLVPSQNWFDALFPVINEHEKWKEPLLMKQNFFFALGTSTEKNRHFNGFVPKADVMSHETLLKNSGANVSPIESLPESSKDYIRKIVELCRTNNIEPVFIHVPLLPQYLSMSGYENRSREMAELLDGLNTSWLDGNAVSSELNTDAFRDELSDIGNNHLNIKGANIYTKHLGEELLKLYGERLAIVTNEVPAEPQQLLNFLSTIKTSELVFMTVNDDASFGWLPGEVALVHKLNLKLMPVDMPRRTYAAILKGDGTVLWEKRDEKLINQSFFKDELLNGFSMPVDVRITSASPPEVEGHIVLNGREYSLNTRGLNCVVYDLEQRKVTRVDMFDLYDRSLYLKELMPE